MGVAPLFIPPICQDLDFRGLSYHDLAAAVDRLASQDLRAASEEDVLQFRQRLVLILQQARPR